MDNLLLWLFTGCRGGVNRARILSLINERPINAHQIAKCLDLNYKTVNHHLHLLEDSKIIQRNKEVKYGAFFFVTDQMKAHYNTFEEILQELNINS